MGGVSNMNIFDLEFGFPVPTLLIGVCPKKKNRKKHGYLKDSFDVFNYK